MIQTTYIKAVISHDSPRSICQSSQTLFRPSFFLLPSLCHTKQERHKCVIYISYWHTITENLLKGNKDKQNLRFSQHCCEGFRSFGMLQCAVGQDASGIEKECQNVLRVKKNIFFWAVWISDDDDDDDDNLIL
jgi:hypothetical protein